MTSAADLMKNPVVYNGNTYFIVDGKLVAVAYPDAQLSVKVNIEVVYDQKWENVFVSQDTGPVAVVFVHPPTIETTIQDWLTNLGMFDSFWVIGAINGLAFCSDLLPVMMTDGPNFPTAQSSDMEKDGDIDDRHQLARELIEKMFSITWDSELVSRTQEAQIEEFINSQKS
jgi:hypothetical protein